MPKTAVTVCNSFRPLRYGRLHDHQGLMGMATATGTRYKAEVTSPVPVVSLISHWSKKPVDVVFHEHAPTVGTADQFSWQADHSYSKLITRTSSIALPCFRTA